MRVLEYRNGAPVAALEADVGPYRLHRGDDAVWPPKARAYGGEIESLWLKARPVAIAAGVLALPVVLLTVLLTAVYLYADAVLTWNVPGVTLTISDLVLPLTFLAVQLTNRRHGAPHAAAQLAAGLALLLLIAAIDPYGFDDWVSPMPSLTWRALLAFGFAYGLAGLGAILVFDGARGPRWWTAPLASSLAAALLFSLVYYPLAYLGRDADWPAALTAHFALFFAEGAALLLPYWLLRAAMRPMPGLNGY